MQTLFNPFYAELWGTHLLPHRLYLLSAIVKYDAVDYVRWVSPIQ